MRLPVLTSFVSQLRDLRDKADDCEGSMRYLKGSARKNFPFPTTLVIQLLTRKPGLDAVQPIDYRKCQPPTFRVRQVRFV